MLRIALSGPGLLALSALAALALAVGIAVEPIDGCDARVSARQDARPGFASLAGDPFDPGCR